MSMYANYIMETTDDEVMETDRGFASYRYLDDGKTVYIVHIHVEQEFRKSGEATSMADAIVKEAKERGAAKLLGSVVPSQKTSTMSMKVLLAYGFRLDSASNDFILFRKDI